MTEPDITQAICLLFDARIWLCAKVYAHSPIDHRLDEALALCQDLLQRDSTRATLRDQFKRQFGMTPTEYRQNL